MVRAVLLAALVVSSCLPVWAVRMHSGVTPLAKVITLLEQIETEIMTDGEAEAAAYDKFACFCKNNTGAVSQSITSGKDNVESLSATMGEKTAEKADKAADKAERLKKQDAMATELADTKIHCKENDASYETLSADLNSAIQAIRDATSAVENSRSSREGLVSVKQAVQKTSDLAEALKIIDSGPKWAKVTAFLEQGVDPKDPSYKFHSVPVLNILSQLEDEYKTRKANADSEHAKAVTVCGNMIQKLTNHMSSNGDTISQLGTDIEQLTSLIAATRVSLVQAESTLKDDQLYMTDLTALCEKRANEWDQRSHLRHEELETIDTALHILKANVTQAESVNRRALLQLDEHERALPSPRNVAKVPTFLQEVERHRSDHAVSGAGHQSSGRSVSHQQGHLTNLQSVSQHQRELLDKALGMLSREGRTLGSTALASLAARASADPFLKVKTLIQRLIERLLAEATSEATKKGFCDTELGKLTQDRSFRYSEALSLNAQLRQLEAKLAELAMEITDLTAAKAELETTLKSATQARAAEQASNQADLKTANEGLKAVTEAILILKTFYKDAADATAFAQKASPVDEDNPGAGFEGAYRGKQQASKGIIGLLEVIQADFSRTIRSTTKAEGEASTSFVEFDRSSKADIAGKETKIALDSEDLDSTNSTIQAKMKEMQDNMDLVDGALSEIEALKSLCIDTGMSYAERVGRREKEVEALRKAFCILDEDGVESSLCRKWGY